MKRFFMISLLLVLSLYAWGQESERVSEFEIGGEASGSVCGCEAPANTPGLRRSAVAGKGKGITFWSSFTTLPKGVKKFELLLVTDYPEDNRIYDRIRTGLKAYARYFNKNRLKKVPKMVLRREVVDAEFVSGPSFTAFAEERLSKGRALIVVEASKAGDEYLGTSYGRAYGAFNWTYDNGYGRFDWLHGRIWLRSLSVASWDNTDDRKQPFFVHTFLHEFAHVFHLPHSAAPGDITSHDTFRLTESASPRWFFSIFSDVLLDLLNLGEELEEDSSSVTPFVYPYNGSYIYLGENFESGMAAFTTNLKAFDRLYYEDGVSGQWLEVELHVGDGYKYKKIAKSRWQRYHTIADGGISSEKRTYSLSHFSIASSYKKLRRKYNKIMKNDPDLMYVPMRIAVKGYLGPYGEEPVELVMEYKLLDEKYYQERHLGVTAR